MKRKSIIDIKKIVSYLLVFVMVFSTITIIHSEESTVSAATKKKAAKFYTPAKVTYVNAVPDSQRTIKITWKKKAYAKQYRIYRRYKRSDGTYSKWVKIKTLSSKYNYYYNEGVYVNRAYYYKIRAVNVKTVTKTKLVKNKKTKKYVKKKYKKYYYKYGKYSKINAATIKYIQPSDNGIYSQNYPIRNILIDYIYKNRNQVDNDKTYYRNFEDNYSTNWSTTYRNYNFRKGTFPASFKSEAFPPYSVNTYADFGDAQGFEFSLDNKYVFVTYSQRGSGKNKNIFIVKYDYQKLVSKKLNFEAVVNVSPILALGHGQGISLNKETNKLYVMSDIAFDQQIGELVEIDQNTLHITKRYPFRVQRYNYETKTPDPEGFSNLSYVFAFGDDGYFYMMKSPLDEMYVYRGRLNGDTIEIQNSKTKIMQGMGPHGQSLEVYNGYLYMVYDGVFMRMPIDKLGFDWSQSNDTLLRPQDIQYTVIDTNREFEGLRFDNSGRMHILLVRPAELAIEK